MKHSNDRMALSLQFHPVNQAMGCEGLSGRCRTSAMTKQCPTMGATAVAFVGLFVPSLHWIYDNAWFVGFLVAGGVYCLLMRRSTT